MILIEDFIKASDIKISMACCGENGFHGLRAWSLEEKFAN
jgi:hypothetical protein